MPDEIVGEILHVDGFGTLITNIPGERVSSAFTVDLKGQRIQGRQGGPFQSVPRGSPLAIVGSQGLLEIAVREGNAAAVFGARLGDLVTARPPAD
jgi:S-adenosylmethionine hydrolase